MTLPPNTPAMLLPVRCKLLRKRPSQLWAATCEADGPWSGRAVGAGVFLLNRLNMGARVSRMGSYSPWGELALKPFYETLLPNSFSQRQAVAHGSCAVASAASCFGTNRIRGPRVHFEKWHDPHRQSGPTCPHRGTHAVGAGGFHGRGGWCLGRCACLGTHALQRHGQGQARRVFAPRGSIGRA